MDKLKTLLSLCKCGVFLTMNEHRNYYQTAAKKLEEIDDLECPPEIRSEVREQMIETNTVVGLQFYPDTPIGSYLIYHHDLETALDEALACLGHNAQVHAGRSPRVEPLVGPTKENE